MCDCEENALVKLTLRSDHKRIMNTAPRPQHFSEYIGQEKARRVIEILCESAKRRGIAVGHVLLCGASGLGKSTLAKLIASEMQSRLIEIVSSSLSSPDQLTMQLANLKERDVLLLDEIHLLSSKPGMEETVFTAMEDSYITIVPNGFSTLLKSIGASPSSKSSVVRMPLPSFTMVGCTTKSVSRPLQGRFVETLVLEPLSNEEIQRVVLGAAKKLSFDMPPESAHEIALRGRGTPRTAIQRLKWVIEYCSATGSPASPDIVRQAFALREIDSSGLTSSDRRILSALVDARAPVGIETLSLMVGDSVDAVSQAEGFLVADGYMRLTPRGRVAQQKAYDLIDRMKAGVTA